MTTQPKESKEPKVGDIIGMSEVTEVNNGRVWGLKYIGKEYIVKRGDKYLSSIYTQANSGCIIDTWSSEKWAKHFRPQKGGLSAGGFSIEHIQSVYDDTEVIEV